MEYSWRFGDGETGEGICVSRTHVQRRQYTSQLTVTDTGGAKDSEALMITVRDSSAHPGVIVDNEESGTPSTEIRHVSGVQIPMKTARFTARL